MPESITADPAALRAAFLEQGGFVELPALVEADPVRALAARAEEIAAGANRAYVPGFKKSGSIGRTGLDQRAPAFEALYEDPALRVLLEAIVGSPLHGCPAWDEHGYALYYYTEAGDHIGWHYDTSFYRGARYTLLLGLVDDSTSRLECRLHRRSAAPGRSLEIALTPGRIVFFDGDAVYHRVTPLGEGERRICLAMELVTDPRMSRVSRLVTKVKDSVGYFGFGRKR